MRWRSSTSSRRVLEIDPKHVNSGGTHSDPSDTLWLDGKATNPGG